MVSELRKTVERRIKQIEKEAADRYELWLKARARGDRALTFPHFEMPVTVYVDVEECGESIVTEREGKELWRHTVVDDPKHELEMWTKFLQAMGVEVDDGR